MTSRPCSALSTRSRVIRPRTAGDIFRDLRRLKEWKQRHPDQVIGYPSENQNRLWSWQGGFYELDRLISELFSWEGVEPR